MSRPLQALILLVSIAVVVVAAAAQHRLVLHAPLSPERLIFPLLVGTLFGSLLIALARSRASEREASAIAATRRAEIAALNDRLSETVRLQGSELRHANARVLDSDRLGAIGMLASGVAHDFNNLLTIVLSGASWLQAEVEPGGESAEVLGCVRSAGERGATLTRQLLSLARPPSASREGPEAACLNRAIRELEPLLGRLLGRESRLEATLCDGQLVVPLARASIEQVLLNLVVNARDAMPGGGRVTVETTRLGATAQLLVRDSGTGMSAEIAQRIFEPFFTTRGEGRGSGLGLAVVRDAMARSGGRVEVESAPGAGTTFRLAFELRPEPIADSGEFEAVQPPSGGVVLFADEDAGLRQLVSALLGRAGHVVHTFPGQRDALEHVRCRLGDASPVWLVTDLLLADGDGQSLAHEARKLRPDLAVILASSIGAVPMLPRTTLLAKPFGVEALVASLGAARRLLEP